MPVARTPKSLLVAVGRLLFLKLTGGLTQKEKEWKKERKKER